MVFIPSFDTFVEVAQRIFKESPDARYSIKFRHYGEGDDAVGKFYLKVTDDKVTVTHKTSDSEDLKKLEKLNNLFIRQMTEPVAKRTFDLPATSK
eukprot:TRINITY_DN3134_c0_g1_i1.p1 TRINITY_DN3134_c0_g1~~TRINITY_DN3134_c0_g1_i1.p1  ORF type:complete len:105 (+),score=36.50 TRINITY_DN3134_c0_g1_i1:33-317(+)